MSIPENYQKSGFALSSWNYGSFHDCNPYYQKKEYLRAEEQNLNNNQNNNNNSHVRAQSANLNRFGKRKLQEDERIVTEDYLIMMKDFKAIKSKNNDNNPNLKKNVSSSNLRKNEINRQNNENYIVTESASKNSQSNSNLINNTHDNNNSASLRNSSKPFKFQLSYDEWAAVKAKQQEIYKKVKIIKESEDQNFEIFNKKIDKNYKVIQDQNFSEWLQKKQFENQKQKHHKLTQEEIEELGKEKKKNENSAKLEMWFKRQAEILDNEARMKKMKEKRSKEQSEIKQKEEEIKKLRANEAFKLWMKKKEEEKKIETRVSSKNNNPQEKLKRHNSTSYYKKGQIAIGPYTNARQLKEIQKRMSAGNYKDINMNYSDDIGEDYYEEEGEEKPVESKENENMDDSLQELSSIKKETAAHEPEPDYD